MPRLFLKLFSLLGMIIFLVVPPGVALAQSTDPDWQVYRNHEHTFTIDYPAGLFTRRGPAEGGDGVTFSNPQSAVTLSIYGFNNGDELPIKTVREIIVENYSDREITYERQKGNWLVLSGYDRRGAEEMIFYQRLTQNKVGDRYSVFEMSWPSRIRGAIDPLLAKISKSITPPRD